MTEFDELVRRNRRRCLWFMRDDYAPVDAAGMLKVLRNLELHGDRETFKKIQPLGYLIWACAGKDPGLNPSFVLNEAKRASRYTQEDISGLAFDGVPPDLADQCRYSVTQVTKSKVSGHQFLVLGPCMLFLAHRCP